MAVARQTLNVVLSEKEKRGIDLVHKLYPHVTVLNVSSDLGRFPVYESEAYAEAVDARLPGGASHSRGGKAAWRV